MTAITPQLLRVALVILERADAANLPGLGGSVEHDNAHGLDIGRYAGEIGIDADRLRALAEGDCGGPISHQECAAITAFFERQGIELTAVQKLIDQNEPGR